MSARRRSLAALSFAATAFALARAGVPAAPPDSSPTLAPATASPLPAATASPLPAATASPLPAATASPLPDRLSVRGQILSLGGGFLVFTTGQAVRLDPAVKLPAHAPLGISVRATIATATRSVVALAFSPKTDVAGEIDAARIPPPLLASSIQSLPSISAVSAAGPLERQVTMTIRVSVPDQTPPMDDVYLATDRSDFGAAEVRLQRIDLHRWTVQLSLKSGTTLRYEFTRGYNTTIERDRSGGIVTPRAVTVTDGLTTDDTVQRWSDIQ